MATLSEIMALKQQSNPYLGLAQLGNTVADVMRMRNQKQQQQQQSENQAQAASLLAEASKNPEQGKELFAKAYQLAPQWVSGFVKTQKEMAGGGMEPKPYQMASGELAGWSFNPNDNSWSLDQKVSDYLQSKAEKESQAKDELGVSDIKGINSDITGLIKEPAGVVKSYESISTLKENASPASKLAAVFAFMKSIDPTSVVRESEQGQVYAAQGAAKQIAGKINSILGEGELSDEGFADLVATSKSLADNAIDSATRAVDQYLGAYGDKIGTEDKGRLMNRIPKYKGYSKTNVIIESHPEFGEITEDDISETMRKNNMTRDQVLEALGVNNG